MRINNRTVHAENETLKFEKIRGEWRASIMVNLFDHNREQGKRFEKVEIFSWGKTKAEANVILMQMLVLETRQLLAGKHLTQIVRAKKEAEQAQMQDFEEHVRKEA